MELIFLKISFFRSFFYVFLEGMHKKGNEKTPLGDDYMGQNLKHQFFQAIDNAIAFGESKHSAKQNGIDTDKKIYSYSACNSMRDTAKDFANYLKREYPEVKKTYQINQGHIKNYLESKIPTCSQKTLEQYSSRLDKLGKLCGERYKFEMNWKVKAPQKMHQSSEGRTLKMDTYVLHQIYTEGSPSQSKTALKLSEAFGLRVSECVHIRPCDINRFNHTLFINESKGGRSRTLDITTPKQIEAIRELKEWEEKNDRAPSESILTVKAGSVNHFLQDRLERKGITEYKEHKTGVHSIRKLYATDRYNELRQSGIKHTEAWGIVSVELGHSANRLDLFQTYVVQ